MLWLLVIAAVFGAFVWMAWRMSSPANDDEPVLGHNLPSASTTMPQFGPYPLSVGPELGTPESLVPSDVERALEHEHHRDHFDEERRD